jgi:single stranded DNA-binding protein (ssb)
MNKIILMGRLTKDPEVRYSQGEKPMAIARYTLAVDRKFKRDGEPNADFINCIAFGKNGEFAEKYLHKGVKILVEGRWQSGSYTNRDGQKVYTNDCVVESCEFAESKNASQSERPQLMAQTDSDGFMSIPDGIDEELSFN